MYHLGLPPKIVDCTFQILFWIHRRCGLACSHIHLIASLIWFLNSSNICSSSRKIFPFSMKFLSQWLHCWLPWKFRCHSDHGCRIAGWGLPGKEHPLTPPQPSDSTWPCEEVKWLILKYWRAVFWVNIPICELVSAQLRLQSVRTETFPLIRASCWALQVFFIGSYCRWFSLLGDKCCVKESHQWDGGFAEIKLTALMLFLSFNLTRGKVNVNLSTDFRPALMCFKWRLSGLNHLIMYNCAVVMCHAQWKHTNKRSNCIQLKGELQFLN